MKVNFAFHCQLNDWCVPMATFLRCLIQSGLKNAHQLQQYIFTCWTLHICFALYWCYLFVNVILPFWGQEFPGSWRWRKEKDSFQASWWYFETASWNNCKSGDLIILYDSSNFYVLCAAGVLCWIMQLENL